MWVEEIAVDITNTNELERIKNIDIDGLLALVNEDYYGLEEYIDNGYDGVIYKIVIGHFKCCCSFTVCVVNENESIEFDITEREMFNIQ